jgi:hypothetical protein
VFIVQDAGGQAMLAAFNRLQFKLGQFRKPQLLTDDYSLILNEALSHFAMWTKPSGNLFLCLYGQRHDASSIGEEALLFAQDNMVWAEKGTEIRMRLEDIKPEARLGEMHRLSIGLCRAKMICLLQWDKVLVEVLNGNIEPAIQIRQTKVRVYEDLAHKVTDDLLREANRIHDGWPALLASLHLDPKVLKFLEIDPESPALVAFRDRL